MQYFFLDPKCHQRGYEELDFSVISHIDDELISKRIPMYCNKNKRNILLHLKRGQSSVGRDKLLLKSREYFEQQLKGIIDEDVYSIPYVDDNSMHPDLEPPFRIIMNTMKTWCYGDNNQNEGKMKGLVICGYSLDSHLKFMNFSSNILKNDCFSSDTEELHEESDKLIIAYNPAEKVIFLIRMANSNNLENEMKRSTNDVMKFVLLHFDVLKSSGVQVINLLVKDEEFDDQLHCESCKHQVISLKSIQSSDYFQSWWEEKNEKFSISVCYQNINPNFSEDFCVQLLFFLATHKVQGRSLIDGILPLKTDFVREQVEEANVLTKEHLRIIYSNCKRHIVFGWYDSGISVVAQKRAEVIASMLGSNEILYFICCDSKSQLLADKEDNSNMKLILNESFSNLSDIIKEILEKSKTILKVHLVAVEYDLEELNNNLLAELNDMFARNDKLKDSYIFLACQPIQKERNLEIKGENYSTITKTESNLYDRLSMEQEKLYYNKRNTLEINTLIAFTADELEHETTVCKLSCSNVKGAKNPVKTEPKTETQTHDQSFTEAILEKEKIITFDEAFELYNMNNSLLSNNHTSDAVIVQSKFKYIIKPSKSGVNKELVKPSIVEIKYTEHSRDFMILNLKITLDQIISRHYRHQKDYEVLKPCKSEKHVILHFDIENDFPQYFKMVFHLMGKEGKVTSKYKEFVKDHDKTILICNHRTFRGLTNSSVIVVLEPSLYHQKFYVLESLSRASVVLDIIVLDMAQTDRSVNSAKSFHSIIKKWKTSKEEELFNPCKLIDGTDINIREEENLSEDMGKIRKWLTESKSLVSNNETDLRLNIER